MVQQILILFSSDIYILCSLHIASSGQKYGSCMHPMANFDGHNK